MKTTSRSARSARIATRSPLRSRPGPGDGDQPRVHLARDDVRERRLAEPGRSRQQHVVDRLAALLGRRERDRELLAHDLLPDELVELARAQRAVGLVLVAARRGRADEALLLAHAGPPRRSAASAVLDALLGRALGARERGLRLGDREAERDERVARREVRVVGRRRRRAVAGRDRLERRGAELVAQLHDDALGRALADARRPTPAAPGRPWRSRAAACPPDSPRAAPAPWRARGPRRRAGRRRARARAGWRSRRA